MKIFQKLNAKILEKPGTVYGWAILIFALAIILSNLLQIQIVTIFLGFLFWLVGIYICYLTAKKQNRSRTLWVILSAWLNWIAILILVNLKPLDKDTVIKN